jgi:hypothetical protein
MNLKPWQPEVFKDQLTEIGKSEGDLATTKYAYLEFRDKGRVRNVTAMSDLVGKLRQSLGVEDCEFHLISGQNAQTKDETNMLVAMGEPQGTVYAVDMRRRGLDIAMANSQRARTVGRVLQLGGILLALVGLPLSVVLIGIPMVLAGIFIWRSGKKMAAAMQYQLSLLEQQSAMIHGIPGVRLL